MSEFDDGPCSGQCTTVHFNLITVPSFQFILNDDGPLLPVVIRRWRWCPGQQTTVHWNLITVPSSDPSLASTNCHPGEVDSRSSARPQLFGREINSKIQHAVGTCMLKPRLGVDTLVLRKRSRHRQKELRSSSHCTFPQWCNQDFFSRSRPSPRLFVEARN